MSNSRDFQTAKMLPFQSGFCSVWLTWLLMLLHRPTSLEVQIRTYQDAALKTSGILLFHSFTGWDVVSAFHEKDKRYAWQTWDVCGVFSKLSKYPPAVEDCDMNILEKSVVTMYDRSSTARLDMFARKQRAYEAISPTRAALRVHVKRAAYEAGCIWSQTETQNPADWGWTRQGDVWQIFSTSNLPIAESCQQLNRC